MASRLRSSDHVIVVSLLVGVIFVLILERGKESSVGPKEETQVTEGDEREDQSRGKESSVGPKEETALRTSPTADPTRSPPDSAYRRDREAQRRTDLLSLTFFERTGGTGPMALKFGVNSSQLTTRLSDPLGVLNNDFATNASEFYDVFYSDADGSFNVNGKFVTIEAVFNRGAPAGGGLNLAEVQLDFSAGSTDLADSIASFVALGDNALPSTVGSAVDGNLLTHTTMGNTIGQMQRLRVTVSIRGAEG